MIDFVKNNVVDTSIDLIENNELLDFLGRVSHTTGEVIKGKYVSAFYKGLEFKIYYPTEANPNRRLTVEGSLHKYWNNGAHNFNDFGIDEVNEVLNDLDIKFKLKTENCVLRSLEIGVNVIPPIRTIEVLKSCIMHKGKPFKWQHCSDEGEYIQVEHQRYFIKAYNKRKHYQAKGFEIPNEILRFEIKYSKLRDLNEVGINTLADLMDYGLYNFKDVLLREWNNIIFANPNELENHKHKYNYTSHTFWLDQTKDGLKYHRTQLRNTHRINQNSLKKKIGELIEKKCEELNTSTHRINPLYIGLKRGVGTFQNSTKNQDPNRRFCSVTGFNISMQKKDSFYLSHTGLRCYLKTDKKVFNELKRKHLTKTWTNSDIETQIKEIAHNIRDTATNLKNKQKRIYQKDQLVLFDLGGLTQSQITSV